MTHKKNQTNTKPRRKALKRIAIGGGVMSAALTVPGKWTRPVVNSVVLPVHAATSNVADSSSTGIENITYYEDISDFVNGRLESNIPYSREEMYAQDNSSSKSMVGKVLSSLVSEAQAQQEVYLHRHSYQLCIKLNGTVVTVDFIERSTIDSFIDVMSGTGTLGSAIDLPAACSVHGGSSSSIVVTNPTPEQVDYSLSFQGASFPTASLPEAPCAVPASNCGDI